MSNVPNATVFLDDQNKGGAGRSITNLTPGTYQVRVSAPGYAPYETSVVIRPGVDITLIVAF